MKLLVCGSRRWNNSGPIWRELNKLPRKGTILVHGDALGADRQAAAVARRLGWIERRYPADWKSDPGGAGLRRNREMLAKEHLENEPIDLVIAFAADFKVARGTMDMCGLALAVGIEVRRFSE